MTDRQMDARGKTICLPTLKGGDIITQKALMQELQFLNSACHLILVSSCRTDKIETQFGDGRSSMGNNSKSINARVIVLALCMFSNAG